MASAKSKSKFTATANGLGLKLSSNQVVLFDPRVSDFVSFISHAHSDHAPSAVVTKPYCTHETYELIKLRDPFFEANIVKEDKQIKFDNFSARLISAGHVLGSVQTVIETDGQKIIYSGDFKTQAGLTCKPIKIEQADVLVIESTYGSPEYVFEPIEQVRKKMIEWTRKQLAAKHLVDIGGYQVGKSQEAIKLLNDNGIIPMVSETIRNHSEVYNKFGVGLKFLDAREKGDVLVKPMHHLKYKRSGNVKSCALTGWSIDSNSTKTAACDIGFPLSDHADYNQILEYIAKVAPKQVYCIHGYTRELAATIRKKLHIAAKALNEPAQLSGQKFLTDF
jgi:Cft2 family RNA processing exonuclease